MNSSQRIRIENRLEKCLTKEQQRVQCSFLLFRLLCCSSSTIFNSKFTKEDQKIQIDFIHYLNLSLLNERSNQRCCNTTAVSGCLTALSITISEKIIKRESRQQELVVHRTEDKITDSSDWIKELCFEFRLMKFVQRWSKRYE